jgi:hypothetical protein
MIPKVNSALKNINPDIVALAQKFPERIETWKSKFKKLPGGFIVIPEIKKFDHQHHLDSEEEGAYGEDFCSHSDETLVSAIEYDGLIFRVFLYLTRPQWVYKGYWPDCYPEDGHPPVVMASFCEDNFAKIDIGFPTSSTEGYNFKEEESLWPLDKVYLKGSWEQAYNHLVALSEVALSRTRVIPEGE